MTAILWVKKHDQALHPYDELGWQEFEHLPENEPLLIEAKLLRNPGRHRLRWALISCIARAVGEDREDVSDKIKIACGHFRVLHFPDGRYERKAKSISFSQMDELAFREYFEKEVAAVYELYGILPKDAQREIDAMLAPRTEKTR